MTSPYYFYMLRCADTTLYCGITKDITAREKQHNAGTGSKYVKAHGGGNIIYTEQLESLSAALKREAAVKKWPKAKKEALLI